MVEPPTTPTTVDRPDRPGLPAQGVTQPDDSPAHRLQRFCRAIISLATPEQSRDALLSPIFQELMQVLGEGARGITTELRRELSQLDAAIEQFEQRSRFRYLESSFPSHSMLEQLTQTRAEAVRALTVLEALDARQGNGGRGCGTGLRLGRRPGEARPIEFRSGGSGLSLRPDTQKRMPRRSTRLLSRNLHLLFLPDGPVELTDFTGGGPR